MAKHKGMNKKTKARIAQLEAEKSRGLIQCIIAIAACIVLIVAKIGLESIGVLDQGNTITSAMIWITALVLAGVAGIGSRNYMRANNEIKQLQQSRK